LGELFPQASPCQEVPAWWKAALKRMKELGRPGLVFIAPENEADLEKLGRSIRDLLESGDSRAQEIFCYAVVVCLRINIARVCLPDDAAPGRVLVLDESGRVIEKAEPPGSALEKPEAFEERFSSLIHGEGERRLSASADRLRPKLTDTEKAAFTDLSADAVAARDSATATLAGNSEMLMSLIVRERRATKEAERAARLRQIVDARFKAADEKTPGPRLPFGTWFDPGTGCGIELEDGVSIQCGMARLEGKGQRFLRFLKE
jgi:hypothetical protein